MLGPNIDLLAALVTVALVTAVYLPLAYLLPAEPGSLLGHGLGVLGSVLMLATETLYSLRKRSWRAGWGPMSWWLSAHIFTGIVGPYLVLLHTGFRFGGLAGVTMLMASVVVASGFVGRYIYTAVPHAASGAVLAPEQLVEASAQAEARLAAWLGARPGPLQALAERLGARTGAAAGAWQRRRTWRAELARLDRAQRREASELRRLLLARQTLARQTLRYAGMRRALGLWHALHVPFGIVLFTAALLHILAALYFR